MFRRLNLRSLLAESGFTGIATLLIAEMPLASSKSIEALVAPEERFVIGKQVAHLLCAGGILDNKAGAALLGKPERAATSRNWATVLKPQAMIIARQARSDAPAAKMR